MYKKECKTTITPIIGATVNTNSDYMNSRVIKDVILDFKNNFIRVYLEELEIISAESNLI